MAKLQLTLACGLYDRTIPLLMGTVVPEGIELNFLPMSPGELFRRQGRHAEFDVAEFSMSTLSHLRDEGDQRLVAIPVFPSRRFRHCDMFINTNSGSTALPTWRASRSVPWSTSRRRLCGNGACFSMSME